MIVVNINHQDGMTYGYVLGTLYINVVQIKSLFVLLDIILSVEILMVVDLRNSLMKLSKDVLPNVLLILNVWDSSLHIKYHLLILLTHAY